MNARAFNTVTIDFPGYHHTYFSYSETIDTGATAHEYNKEITGIYTGMVRITLPFDKITATTNGIRFKYRDRNISQETDSVFLKLTVLPVEADCVHLLDILESGLMISLVKRYDPGCTA